MPTRIARVRVGLVSMESPARPYPQRPGDPAAQAIVKVRHNRVSKAWLSRLERLINRGSNTSGIGIRDRNLAPVIEERRYSAAAVSGGGLEAPLAGVTGSGPTVMREPVVPVMRRVPRWKVR